MTAVLVNSPNAPPSTTTPNHHYHRLFQKLTQCTTISIPHLKQIHAQILRTIPPPNNLFLYSRLLHFSSLQDLTYTLKLFNQTPSPNTFMYNTLIRAYAHSKDHKEQAFTLFQELLEQENLFPDNHTFPFVLKACAYLFAIFEGRQAHAQLLKNGLGSDVYINNSLIHFYASCGSLEYSRKVFDEMPERSVVSWNAIIDALVQMGDFHEGLNMFVEMKKWFVPDGYTVQSVIDACAGLGALSMGMWAHAYVLRKCEFDANFDVLLNNSLVEMYSKCGSLRMAVQVFESMISRDANSWNAMILGFAMHGEVDRVFEYFSRMIDEEKLVPNSITFVGILSACNHRGLVDKGRKYFETMVNKYHIKPVLQHYGCLIDLLARNGQIDEALDIVSNMPIKPDAVIWRSILDACRKNNMGLELSKELARQIMESEGDSCSGVYVLLSRVYASANRWNEVGFIRKLMTDKGVTKEPGCSTIEINGVVHEFFAGDTSHPQTKEIYQQLDDVEERLKFVGHVPDSSQAPMVDDLDDEKGNSLRLHSERLAIAFGLLNSKPGIPIRIFKNLRVCNDCHNVTKSISRVFNVDIIVRDRIRFHHFRNGSCSCKDYW
ncbi:Pentatricopeptide repeat-containing protein [Abeliophyllum distichum]|uniref:Pentatricopeptide repeat-containing protein n=1 Tax=Abeliophyllum distichum TaxID=126358 RepID=A0ABD1U346_9LAMI